MEGREYEREQSFTNDEGKRYRPDVIVRLPEGKDVIIDAKVSLVAYDKLHAADTEAEREQALAEHVLSVRNHIHQLAEKRYEDIKEVNSLEYVLMFLPIEGAFQAAMEADQKLFLDANKKKVLLVSPSTLLFALRTIHSIWQYEHQNRNAREMAERAGKLYDKFVGFTDDLLSVEKHLKNAQRSFGEAKNKLSEGRGNLVRQSEQLRKLGVRHKKQLSQDLVERSETPLIATLEPPDSVEEPAGD